MRADLIATLAREAPQLEVFDFGHCDDGGDHVNLVWPSAAGERNETIIERPRQLVYDRVVKTVGGSFSAEHGVGPHNIAYYRRFTGAAERKIASQLKSICDPKGLLGRVDSG